VLSVSFLYDSRLLNLRFIQLFRFSFGADIAAASAASCSDVIEELFSFIGTRGLLAGGGMNGALPFCRGPCPFDKALKFCIKALPFPLPFCMN
jgi:hypothetical protein